MEGREILYGEYPPQSWDEPHSSECSRHKGRAKTQLQPCLPSTHHTPCTESWVCWLHCFGQSRTRGLSTSTYHCRILVSVVTRSKNTHTWATVTFPTLAFQHLTAPIPEALPNRREVAQQQGTVQECRDTWEIGIFQGETRKNGTQNETQRGKINQMKVDLWIQSLFFHLLTKCSISIYPLDKPIYKTVFNG